MSQAMTEDFGDTDDRASGLPAAAGPGRYFDQAVFDLHFVLLSARARRLAAETELPFSVDQDGRVTLKPCG